MLLMLGHKKRRRVVKVVSVLGSFLLIVVLLVTSYIIFPHSPKVEAAWYNTNWSYRNQLTINDADVSTINHTTLTNFPVLVYITDPNLETVSNGGLVSFTNGQDIVFTASDGVTLLKYEIASYSPTSGALQAWVNIASLPNTGSNIFFMYYGNSSAPANTTANAQGTWNSNFSAVYHLEQSGNGTAGEYVDSTSNGNGMQGGAGTSAKVPSLSTGQITGGQFFAGGQMTEKATATGLPTNNSTSQTFSIWYEVPVNPSTNENLIVVTNGTDGNQLRFSSVNDTIGMYQWGGGLTLAATTPPAAGSWHYAVWTHNGTTNTLYIDGVSVATSTTALQTGTPNEVFLGSYDTTPDEPFIGTLDEAEVSKTAETPDWISTSYNNQRSPTTFLSEGSLTVQNEPPATPTLIFPPASGTAISILPEFQLSTTDINNSYIDYAIELFSGASCGTLLNTVTETSSTAGWLNEDSNSGTAYASGIILSDSSVATYQYPTQLTPNQAYSWEAKAIDPGATNTYSALSACQSFTTAPSEVQIRGGTNINGGTTIQ